MSNGVDSEELIITKCRSRSFFAPIGYLCSDCGYCKAEDTSASYFVQCKSLCPSIYQELADRGWRRSGSLVYIPDPSRSCCPHYTIRLSAANFKTTRDQRQALHRWNRYVLGSKYIDEISRKYPKSKQDKKRDNNSFDLISTIQESETSNIKPDITPAHRFEVSLEPSEFTEEKFLLFENYQTHVHHEEKDDISRSGFRRFLCSSPLHRHHKPLSSIHDSDAETPVRQYGSFHQCYRLDGRLIAFAVLDLLPHAVSGVYFVYHSDFASWSFGKLSALREAALAVEGGYEWYYMGYYIHGCAKMRYKGDYRTQMVLDMESVNDEAGTTENIDDQNDMTNTDEEAGPWYPLDAHMIALMSRRKWVSMKRERRIQEMLHHQREEQSNQPVESLSSANKVPPDDYTSTPDSTLHAKDRIPTAEESKNQEEENLASSIYDVSLPNPLAVQSSSASLLTLGMPGLLSPDAIRRTFDLGAIRLSLGDRARKSRRDNTQKSFRESGYEEDDDDEEEEEDEFFRMHDLVAWNDDQDVTDESDDEETRSGRDGLTSKGSLKEIVAVLAGVVGPIVAKEMVVDFGR